VIYLCQVYQLMLQKLDLPNRFDWLTKDFEALNNSELYQISPSNAWLKIKAKNKLSGKQLSIIQSLSQWREKTAQSENRPKNWLIRDDLLIELAKLQPKTVIELSRIRGINERAVKRYGQIICQLISEAIDKPPIPLNSKNKSSKKTQQDEAVVDVLSALVRIRADENSINPSILANRKDLEKLLCDDVDNPILSGWRYSMVGKELQELLQGQISLSLKENSVMITAQ
jgi:ribonuclease D